jgi:hypothetical protein
MKPGTVVILACSALVSHILRTCKVAVCAWPSLSLPLSSAPSAGTPPPLTVYVHSTKPKKDLLAKRGIEVGK